ncbi:MAG: GNAT family N-acetyltransferase [Gammaproteobacteria bacterium]|nr:GNAT family N-acetyltransferase [Gammaproteobacteria bacterium]
MPVGSITRLRCGDLAQLENLLRIHHLPAEDCAEQRHNFYGIFDQDDLVAAGGLEPAANYALLRSLVVQERYRSRGLARALAEFLIKQAQSEGRKAVYLLTETAETYFEKLGFSRLDRAGVPLEIRQTRQFSSLCPDTASCMVMTLSAN